jgi:hypothetical protein
VAHAGGATLVTLEAAGHNAPAMFHGGQLQDAVERFLSEQDLLPSR